MVRMKHATSMIVVEFNRSCPNGHLDRDGMGLRSENLTPPLSLHPCKQACTPHISLDIHYYRAAQPPINQSKVEWRPPPWRPWVQARALGYREG